MTFDPPDGPPTPPEPLPPSEPHTDAAMTGDGPRLEPVVPAGSGGASRPVRLAGYLLATVAGVVLTVGVLTAMGSLGPAGTASPTPSAAPSASSAVVEGNALGDPNAPVMIEIWADYQCPFCSLQAHGIEPSIERSYAATGRARIVFRDFAFLGQESVDAAVAAQCAGRQDAYWYYHDLLFAAQQGENQGAFARDNLVGLARFAGLDATAFTACLDDPAVAKAVTDEKAIGQSYGITSTPTMRIVGPASTELLAGLKPLSVVGESVDRVMDPSATPTPGPSPSPAASPSGGGGATSAP